MTSAEDELCSHCNPAAFSPLIWTVLLVVLLESFTRVIHPHCSYIETFESCLLSFYCRDVMGRTKVLARSICDHLLTMFCQPAEAGRVGVLGQEVLHVLLVEAVNAAHARAGDSIYK